MNKIYIQNSQEKLTVTRATSGLIRRAINATLKYEKFEYPAELSVTLVDNSEIQQLNKEYRNIDRETDVLSFPLLNDMNDIIQDEENPYVALGDIVISLEKAISQAQEYGHSTEREIAFLCVHSVLHLLLYDHETSEDDEKIMFSKQEDVMKILKLTRI